MELLRRPRRNRSTPGLRRLTAETSLRVEDLILPVFVHGGTDPKVPVPSMPGVHRLSIASLVEECRSARSLGLPAVAIFPVIDPAHKDPGGTHALSPDNLLFRALAEVRSACPDLTLVADVALDPYTSHGHDGVLTPDGREVDNDRTVELLCRLAVLESQAGATVVAPSDMMDGRVGAIRRALDAEGATGTAILAYAAKFASAFYGPFRDAVGSRSGGTAPLDKTGYQLQPGNAREALLEVDLDEEEGADMVMVKPAGLYLDVIRAVRERTLLPVAAYQVSGEYAQIVAAVERGWLDLEACRDESLLAIKRAGAGIILTYFALEVARALRG